MTERDSWHGGEECPAQALNPFCIHEEVFIDGIKRGLRKYVWVCIYCSIAVYATYTSIARSTQKVSFWCSHKTTSLQHGEQPHQRPREREPSSIQESPLLFWWSRWLSSPPSSGWWQHLCYLCCSGKQEVQEGKTQDCIGCCTSRKCFFVFFNVPSIEVDQANWCPNKF